MSRLADRVLPDSQRRTLSDLTEDLDLTAGDSQAKRSAYWTMLFLSAVIAGAGVLTDSTATVIGAMIIAPLSTPIMGIALGIASREPGAAARAIRFVFFGALLVIVVGVFFGLILPSSYELLSNSQISSRTSPTLLDLIAAVATGFAGAVGLARRDVSAVLPGVAIAISLVPPLVVSGVCFGYGSVALGIGALILFLSNLFSLVLAGSLIFASVAFRAEIKEALGQQASRRKAVITMTLLLFVVIVPLVTNTVANVVVTVMTQRVQNTTAQWLLSVPGAQVESVDFASSKVRITVQTPNDLPSTDELLAALNDDLPSGIPVVLVTTVGEDIELGSTS